MTKEKPLFSIITVVLNSADYIEQAILSVIGQSYDNIEYIVIDGGSTDGTLEIIRRYKDRIAWWVSEPDNGIYDAMNKGIKKAGGDFIGILNADDWYEPGIIRLAAEKIAPPGTETPPEPVTLYCDYYRWDEELGEEAKTKKYSTMKYWNGMSISHQGMFIHKALYDKLGLYDLHYRLASDYDFFLRMIRAGVKFVKIETHGVNFRMSGQSVTHVNESIREASRVNRHYFGSFSKKHASFILNNHVPSLAANVKLLLYKWVGKEKTAKLRRLWRRLKRR